MSAAITGEQRDGSAPYVPELPAGVTVRDAALAYAAAGWYVAPVDPQTKNPGSRLGKGWQLSTSRDPSVIHAWWQQWPEASLALHVGRSGAVCLDVDDPAKLPDAVLRFLDGRDHWITTDVPFQSTRDTEHGRGHYLFAAPPGRYGNSLAGFRAAGLDGWGEVRGLNAVIVVEPSVHTKPGGRYRWVTTGPLPAVPPALAELLRPPGAAAGAGSGPTLQQGSTDTDGFLASLPGPETCPVVRGALDELAPQLAAMDPGGRHDFMLSAVQRLVRLGEQGHHGAASALEELYAAFLASKPDAGESEYYDAVTGAVRNVLAAQTLPADAGCCPAWLQERWMQQAGFVPPPVVLPAAVTPDTPDGVVITGPWHVPGAAGREPQPQVRNGTGKFTDAALAETFAAEALVGRYRWAPGLKWLQWDGSVWKRVTDGDVAEQARLWALGHIGAAAALARLDPEGQVDDTEIKSWTAVAKSAGRLTSLARLAQAIAGIRTDPAAFDADPDILNVRNGVVDLRTGALHPPDPRRLVTKQARVDHLPGARHPDWDAALEALPPDERAWLQLRLGQAITGHMTPDDVMPICQGSGENGKGTLFDAVVAALGDYHVRIADRVLTASPDAHPTELMDFRGARLATIDETPEGRQLNVVRLKKTVGSTYITARHIAQDSVTYRATHSLFVLTNYEPIVTETDHGTWRRLAMLRFPYTFRKPGDPLTGPQDRRGDPGLRARLLSGDAGGEAARSAVLAWLLDGAWAWYAAGAAQMPPHTPAVTEATERLRADSDAVYGYWNERLEPAEGYAVLATELLHDFNQWAATTKNMQPWGDRMFKSRFGDHQITVSNRVRHQKVTRWAGDPVLSHPASGYGIGSQGVTRDPVLWVGIRFPGSPLLSPDKLSDQPKRPPALAALGTPVDSIEDLSRETVRSTERSQRNPKTDSPTPLKPPVTDSVTESENLPVTSPAVRPETPARTGSPGQREAKAEARRQAVAEAAGPEVPLPALVTRDGAVAPISVDDAQQLLAGLPRLTVDVETSGHPVGHDEYALRTVQLGCADFAVDLDPVEHAGVIQAELALAGRLGAHSATADIVPLAVAGLGDFDTLWAKMDDTVIPAKLHDPASTGSDPGLKEISAYVLGDDATSTPADTGRKALFKAAGWLEKPKPDTPAERNGWHQVNPRCTTMIRYAGSDVLDTGAIADRLPPLPPHLAERERKVAHTVSRIALHGVPIDGPRVAELMTEHTTARDELTRTITGWTPIDNVGSDRQVAQALTEMGVQLPRTAPSTKFPDGQASVAAGVLDTLRTAYSGEPAALIGQVLDWRKHDTVITSFLTPYSQLVRHGDGRARPTVYTLAADTGRMSCVRPNFQQLPREGGIRAIITADPGMSLISADFSSVEIRVAAALSGDQALIQMLLNGVDPHAMAAELVYGPDWTKAQRYAVKRGVFGRIYGGGRKTLARQMGVSEAVAQRLIDAIDTLWPVLSQWSRNITRAVEAGTLTTFEAYSGRLIHLPRNAAYAAPNYIIQGTARELEVDAILAWRDTRWGNSVMWPVHDENDAMVPTDQAEDATAALVECMTSELYGVPITVEASAPSTYWRDSS